MLCLIIPGTFGNTYQLNQRIKVSELYLKQVGIKEATGHNDGFWVEQYLAYCNLKKGDAWCAAMVAYVLGNSGVKAPKSGWSPAWFKPQYVIYTRGKPNNKTPQMADVGGIWFPKMNRIAHTFFIHEWAFGTAFTVTVEGNTNKDGSREGDQVCIKRRMKSQIYQVSSYI